MKTLKLLMLSLAFVFFSCENEEINTEGIDNSSSDLTTVVNAEVTVEEVEDAIDDASMYSGYFYGVGDSAYGKGGHRGNSGFFSDCVEMETVEEENTVTTTITFTEECEDRNGNIITGTIVKTETVTDESSENTVTIDSLSINGYLINGTKSYMYLTSNENGNPEMTGTVDISVETEEGTISKVGTRTVEITAGGETDTWEDDDKTITGSFTYSVDDVATFTMEITTALLKPAGCRYIVSGVKTYTKEEGTYTLDYGDGTCDDVATLTDPDLVESEVVLGRKRHHHDDDEGEDDDEDEDDGEEGEDDGK